MLLMALWKTSTRYDFKNSQSKVTRESDEVELIGDDQYKIEQVQQIFRTHLVKENYPLALLIFLMLKMQKEVC